MMNAVARFCELCHAQAAIYCPSDSAFLCWACDSQVHRANFLVARHVRRIICSQCKVIAGNSISQSSGFFCASCSPVSSDWHHHLDSLSSASQSDCASSTMSSCATSQNKSGSPRCKVDRSVDLTAAGGGAEVMSGQKRTSQGRSVMELKAEGVLVYWCGKLGVPAGDRAVRLGKSALSVCSVRMTSLPFRVTLAASLWFGLRYCGDRSLRTWQVLKRLEDTSGVQAKLISAAESKLEGVLKVISNGKLRDRGRRNHQLEEGWAESECSA